MDVKIKMEPGLGEKEGEKEEGKEKEGEKEKSTEGEEGGSLFDTYPLSTTDDSGKLVFQEISQPNFDISMAFGCKLYGGGCLATWFKFIKFGPKSNF